MLFVSEKMSKDAVISEFSILLVIHFDGAVMLQRLVALIVGSTTRTVSIIRNMTSELVWCLFGNKTYKSYFRPLLHPLVL